MAFNISTNFLLSAALPLDARTVVADIAARDAIAAIERYDGLAVYVLADNNTYQLQGGVTNLDWATISGPTLSALWSDSGTVLTPTNTRNVYVNDGWFRVVQPAGTGGVSPVARFAPGDHTALSAGTELQGFLYEPATKEWDGSAPLVSQSEVAFFNPTYEFDVPQVITDAYTFSIVNNPTAGANCTITNAYAFGCGGNANFMEKVYLSDDGAVNEPVLAFVNDPDTGIRRRTYGGPAKSGFEFLIDGVSAFNVQETQLTIPNRIVAPADELRLSGTPVAGEPGIVLDTAGAVGAGDPIVEIYDGAYGGGGVRQYSVMENGGLLAGTNASRTDFPNSHSIITRTNTGYSTAASTTYGLVVENMPDVTNGAIGIEGFVKLDGANNGFALTGFVGQNAIGDTGDAYGCAGNVLAIRTIGDNIGVYGYAAGSLDNNYCFYGSAGSLFNSGRYLGSKGADVASANDMQLGDGNYFLVTGNTDIRRIYYSGAASVPDWTPGSEITLRFTSPNSDVIDGVATGGVFVGIRLAGALDFTANVGDTLTLVLDSLTTVWYEKSRTVVT